MDATELVSQAGFTSSERRRKEAEKECDTARDEVARLEHSLSDAMEQIEAIQGTNAVHMGRVAELEADAKGMDERYDALRESAEKAGVRVAELEGEAKTLSDYATKVQSQFDYVVEQRDGYMKRVAELEGDLDRKFPIQRTGYGNQPRRTHAPIPWAVAERAYATYAGKYGKGQSLERLSQRGGFSCGEMDMYAPGWEADCTATAELQAQLDRANANVGEGESERCKLRKYNAEYRDRVEELQAQLDSASKEGGG